MEHIKDILADPRLWRDVYFALDKAVWMFQCDDECKRCDSELDQVRVKVYIMGDNQIRMDIVRTAQKALIDLPWDK